MLLRFCLLSTMPHCCAIRSVNNAKNEDGFFHLGFIQNAFTYSGEIERETMVCTNVVDEKGFEVFFKGKHLRQYLLDAKPLRFRKFATLFFLHLDPLKISILGEVGCLTKNRSFQIHLNERKPVSLPFKNRHWDEDLFLRQILIFFVVQFVSAVKLRLHD